MAKRLNDDLFEGTSMTFGEHLEELRKALWKAMIGLVIGLLVGLGVAKYVVHFLETPLERALNEYYLEKANVDIKAMYSGPDALEKLETVEGDGLVPDKGIMVEPAAILECLIYAAPDEFGHIRFKPHQFVARDLPLENVVPLCERLTKQPGDDEGSNDSSPQKPIPARALWDLMTPEDREYVAEVASLDSADDEVRARVVSILNRLADQPQVHQSPDFAKVEGWNEESTRELRAVLRVRDDPDRSRRLNRLLISDALQPQLGKPRVPLVAVPTWKPAVVRIQALGAHEAFMIWLKAGFVAGLVLTSPWIFFQIWQFVAAGLYPHEKRYVYLYLPFSLGLFLAGAALAFFFVFKPVLDFLFSFNASMNIDPDPRISEWLSFVLILPLGFGISFQLPLVMLFLNRIGIFSVGAYLEKWRIAILVIFVISMLLTPADPISMMLMAVPLTILYFGGIMLCKWMPRGRNPFDEAYEP